MKIGTPSNTTSITQPKTFGTGLNVTVYWEIW